MSNLPHLPLQFTIPIIFVTILPSLLSKTVIDIYWNSSNALFKSEEPMLVNYNMGKFSFSQMNLICDKRETYSVYLVPREVYGQCHLGDDEKSYKMVADCSSPHTTTRPVTISFRPVSPIPYGLQFIPGTTYYLLSIRGPYTTSPHNWSGPHTTTPPSWTGSHPISPYNLTGPHTISPHSWTGPYTTSPHNWTVSRTTPTNNISVSFPTSPLKSTDCQKNLKLSILVSNMDRVRVNKPRRRIQIKRGEEEQMNKEMGEAKGIRRNIGDKMEGSYVMKEHKHNEEVTKGGEISNTLNLRSPSHDVLPSTSFFIKYDVYCNLFSLLAIILYYLSS